MLEFLTTTLCGKLILLILLLCCAYVVQSLILEFIKKKLKEDWERTVEEWDREQRSRWSKWIED